MSEQTKIFGWPYRELPSGERVPCAPWIVRWFYHHLWLYPFRWVPKDWFYYPGIRRKLYYAIVERFGWWGYSHHQP